MKVLILLNIISYFLIIIQGTHLGGILLLYFLVGLAFFAMHSLLMLAGTVLFILAIKNAKQRKHNIVIATFCYYWAFALFFLMDVNRSNIGTFEYSPSMIMVVLFVVFNSILIGKVFLYNPSPVPPV